MRSGKKSSRRDGKGGWVRGRRRNADVGDWQRIVLDAQALLADHWRLGVVSVHQLAAAVGVNERTVRRWLAGVDRPPPDCQEAVRHWVANRRRELRPAVVRRS